MGTQLSSKSRVILMRTSMVVGLLRLFVVVVGVFSRFLSDDYHLQENDYRCKSLINSKTISVSKKNYGNNFYRDY